MRLRLVLSVAALVAAVMVVGDAGAAAKPLVKVRYGQSGDALIFFPIYVARDQGFFAEEGIDLETHIFGGGGSLLAAQVSGAIDFMDTAFIHLAKSYAEGVEVVAFASIYEELGLDVAVSTAAYKRLNLENAKTVAEKVRALKGLKIGITAAGSSTDLFSRKLLSEYGLDPSRDVSLVPLKLGDALLSAIEQGVVDAIVYPAPIPQAAELRGAGKILISTTRGDLPEWRGFQYQILAAPRKYLEEKPEIVLGITRAIAKAQKFTRESPAEAKRSVKKFFPKIEDRIIDLSLDHVVNGVPKTPYLAKRGYELNDALLNVGGVREFTLPPFEKLVTNRFAEQALKELGLSR